MVGAALLLAVLTADATDQEFLNRRLKELTARYDDHARQQSPKALRARGAVVRELAHLPFAGAARERAGKLLARIVAGDRSYRIRADTARAIGHVGTAPALNALYRTLFGADGRSRRFQLIHAVLPAALARLHHADDLEWVSLNVLKPGIQRRSGSVLKGAGPLRTRAVALTLEGVGRARARALSPETVALAAASDPEIRAAALRALASLEAGAPVVARALTDGHARVRAAAALHPLLDEAQARRALADRDGAVRRSAIRGLRARPAREGVPLLIARLRAEPDTALRLAIADALNGLTGKEFGTDAQLWSSWWEANRAKFDGPGARDPSGRTYFFDVGLRTARVIFVIDVSASMSRENERNVSRLAHAARELGETLRKLPPSARFAVFAYAAEVRRYPVKQSSAGSREHAGAAVAWLMSLKPAGATNTYGALMHALQDTLRPDTLVLLSDGNPYRCSYQGKNYSEHEQILAEVRRVNADRQVRLHTVALLSGALDVNEREDASAAADFLRRLADENDGEFREVR